MHCAIHEQAMARFMDKQERKKLLDVFQTERQHLLSDLSKAHAQIQSKTAECKRIQTELSETKEYYRQQLGRLQAELDSARARLTEQGANEGKSVEYLSELVEENSRLKELYRELESEVR